jgi:hypothetical protein
LHVMPHLSPSHHKTSKHDCPKEPKDKGKTTKMFRIQIQTLPSQ